MLIFAVMLLDDVYNIVTIRSDKVAWCVIICDVVLEAIGMAAVVATVVRAF